MLADRGQGDIRDRQVQVRDRSHEDQRDEYETSAVRNAALRIIRSSHPVGSYDGPLRRNSSRQDEITQYGPA